MLEAECLLLNSVSSSQKKDACLRRIRNVAQQKEKIVFDKPHWYFFGAKAATNKK